MGRPVRAIGAWAVFALCGAQALASDAVVAVPAGRPTAVAIRPEPGGSCRGGTDLGRLPAVMAEAAALFADEHPGEGADALADGLAQLTGLAQQVVNLCDELEAVRRQVDAHERIEQADRTLIATLVERVEFWRTHASEAVATAHEVDKRGRWAAFLAGLRWLLAGLLGGLLL